MYVDKNSILTALDGTELVALTGSKLVGGFPSQGNNFTSTATLASANVTTGITRAQIPNYGINVTRFQTTDGAFWVKGTGPMATLDAYGQSWQLDTSVDEWQFRWFGADTTGTTDCASAFTAAFVAAIPYNIRLRATPGTYVFSSKVYATLGANGNFDFIADTGAIFKASAGYPHDKLFQLTGGGTSSNVSWRGGYYDGSNIPNDGAGEANVTLYFGMATNTAGAYIDSVALSDVEIYTGTDWLNCGGGSHIFISNAANISVERIRCTGCSDSGVYLSGGSYSDGSTQVLDRIFVDNLSFNSCSSGLAIKRYSQRIQVGRVVGDNCKNVVAIGSSGQVGTGAIVNNTHEVSIDSVVGRYCEQLCDLRNVSNVRVGSVVSKYAGCYVTSGAGYSSTVAVATYMQGASHCTVSSSICDSSNPSLSSPGVYNVRCQSNTTNSVTYYSTNNIFSSIISNNITSSYHEDDANQDYNLAVIGAETNVSDTSPYIKGVHTVVVRYNSTNNALETITGPAASSGPVVSLGGVYGKEALRINPTANQVLFVQANGATTGASSGPGLNFVGETNTNGFIACAGSGSLYLNGSAGTDAVRILYQPSGGTGLSITPAAAGSGITVAARGGNSSEDLILSAKGSGFVNVGASVKMPSLPTSNPHVAGQLWSNSGVLTVSSG